MGLAETDKKKEINIPLLSSIQTNQANHNTGPDANEIQLHVARTEEARTGEARTIAGEELPTYEQAAHSLRGPSRGYPIHGRPRGTSREPRGAHSVPLAKSDGQ